MPATFPQLLGRKTQEGVDFKLRADSPPSVKHKKGGLARRKWNKSAERSWNVRERFCSSCIGILIGAATFRRRSRNLFDEKHKRAWILSCAPSVKHKKGGSDIARRGAQLDPGR